MRSLSRHLPWAIAALTTASIANAHADESKTAPVSPSSEPEAIAPVSPPAEPGAIAPAHSPSESAGEESTALSIFHSVEIHGFISQGALISTANDYLGHSARGSVEFFEAGVAVSTEVWDRLRIGLQLFTRDLGPFGDYALHLDWGYIDYQWRSWLGVRVGRVKLPFGLYNEYSDIDSARTAVLMPQSVYPTVNRDLLLAQTGGDIYGTIGLGPGGMLDYQLFAGTIFIDTADSAAITSVDVPYVAGGQIFWRTPLPGLRLGGSFIASEFDFHLTVDAETTAKLIMAGVVPMGFTGAYTASLDNIRLWVASIEYTRERLLIAAEYARWHFSLRSEIPALVPSREDDSERFYGLVTYRFADWLEVGGYYSVHFLDVNDRSGTGTRFAARPAQAYQKDLAASVRLDINEHWLVKLEAHFIDGIGDLRSADTANTAELQDQWGLFLAKTTLSF